VQYYNDETIQELKIQYFNSTDTLIFYQNGQFMFKKTFSVNDFADQATFDAWRLYNKIQFMFYSDNSDKIKNITVRDLS